MGEQSRKVVEQRYQWLDRELEGKQFIAGDKYSIADISAMVVIDNIRTRSVSHRLLTPTWVQRP
jgi:glutathione S-transferase